MIMTIKLSTAVLYTLWKFISQPLWLRIVFTLSSVLIAHNQQIFQAWILNSFALSFETRTNMCSSIQRTHTQWPSLICISMLRTSSRLEKRTRSSLSLLGHRFWKLLLCSVIFPVSTTWFCLFSLILLPSSIRKQCPISCENRHNTRIKLVFDTVLKKHSSVTRETHKRAKWEEEKKSTKSILNDFPAYWIIRKFHSLSPRIIERMEGKKAKK